LGLEITYQILEAMDPHNPIEFAPNHVPGTPIVFSASLVHFVYGVDADGAKMLPSFVNEMETRKNDWDSDDVC
jgi:hypothetical protein